MTDEGSKASGDRACVGDGHEAGELRAELAHAALAVRRFLFGLCGDWTRSEDLAQEALLKAWQARASFNGRASVQTWVFTIARNHWLGQLRTQARHPREEPMGETALLSSAPPPPAAAARDELATAIAQAVARLPEAQREVLALRENGGLTFAEAAAVLGVPVATVKSRARYALLKLAEELEPFRRELEP